MEFVLGIDVGGTNLVAGCVDTDGRRLEGLFSEPTRPEEGADGVVGRMLALARRSMAALHAAVPGAAIRGVGVGAPGPLDTHRGIVLLTPNLGWVNFPLRDRVSDGLALPTFLDNDANCAVLGEHWRGAAQGTRQALGITIGTGIGGGLILDGRLHHGASDCAGEIGHTTIEMNGRRCACGNYGCLEAYASGPAIARRAMEAVESGAESSLREVMRRDPAAVTAQVVYEAANAG
ncbi:MAG TPA: ROK family protein, partial [Gemmatimonadales bacterium]|nr:ROK family protein [Gemmatimonadales bacterium]